MPKYEEWMSYQQVPGWGRHDAEIVLIGEAPGPDEARLKEPFVGASGARLFGSADGRKVYEAGWAKQVGLSRNDFRIENVIEYCPPHTIADRWDKSSWLAAMEHLHERIARLDNPKVLVPVGNYALYALTGKGKVHWHQRDGKDKRPGILSWRGSILSYVDRRGRTLKVIPTPHPAATFLGRDPGLEPICRRDWQRIKAELATPGLNLPRRTHLISPSLNDLRFFVRMVEQAKADDILVLDIENPARKKGDKNPPIVCIGFALSADFSLTVPTTKSYWGEQIDVVWEWIRRLLALPVHKGAWNNFHEQFWLRHEKRIEIANLWWDGMYMHHALDPTAPHSLAFCASVDTREPYWKDEAKDPEDARKYTSNMAAFYTYNGKDCCVTKELIDEYYRRLLCERRRTSVGEVDGIDFYLQHYAEMYTPFLALTRSGLRVDPVRRQQRFDELVARSRRHKANLIEAGADIYATGKNCKGSISRPRFAHYLYETLGLPKQFKRNKKKGDKTLTTDEVAIRTLMQKYPDKLGTTGPWILEQVRCEKLSQFFDVRRVDRDGYFRSSYGLNTEAGRANSKEHPTGSGSNAQNVDREARDMFLADRHHLGVKVDLSQIEARIVYLAIYALTGDGSLRDKATSRPDQYDQHTAMAQAIFGKSDADWQALSADERSLLRYLGKTTVHAAQRDQGAKGLSDRLAKDGHYHSLAQCQSYITGYRRAVPGLVELFGQIRQTVINERRLVTDWGRQMRFDYARMTDATYREAYSFDPQANCADHMNHRGYLPLHWWLEDHQAGRINAHVHDEVFFSVQPATAYEATRFLVESLEAPYTYHGVPLSIPCEIGIGVAWKSAVSWKRLPPRAQFEEAMHAILEGTHGSREQFDAWSRDGVATPDAADGATGDRRDDRRDRVECGAS